ncbi:unnamed protein product [Rodentolepis nana]|uniref:Myb_DNA-bind_5 domain-containing protein n=1 Tax=Rodentolepis nana TaxID=102285 RepID=A0A0R3T0S6_RODNA|nr:unnamed protein product [Rodentolepis nana]
MASRYNRGRHSGRVYDINISTADMSRKMKEFIIEQVVECLNNGWHPKNMCRFIRERCNERYGPSWDYSGTPDDSGSCDSQTELTTEDFVKAEQKNEGGNAVGNEASEKKNDALSNPPENQPDFTEFDFDTETLSSSSLPQAQRPLGSSARPVRERRVARLDKILQEDRNLRRIEEQMRQAAEAAKRQQQLQQETQPAEEKSSEPPLQEVHQTEQNVSNVKNENPTTSDLPGQVEHMSINAAEEAAI